MKAMEVVCIRRLFKTVFFAGDGRGDEGCEGPTREEFNDYRLNRRVSCISLVVPSGRTA